MSYDKIPESLNTFILRKMHIDLLEKLELSHIKKPKQKIRRYKYWEDFVVKKMKIK